MPGISPFVSILFLIFKKGDKQKNCARYFKIHKYAFLILQKGISKKAIPGFLEFLSMLYSTFQNRTSKISLKTTPTSVAEISGC